MYNETEAIAFFEAYNRAIAEAFERITENIDPKAADSPDFFTQVRHATMNDIQSWHQEPLAAIGGKVPDDYLDELEGVDELVAFTRLAARYCDEELPDLLKIKLGRHADQLKPALRKLAVQVSYESGETSDEVLEAAAAIRLLGEWQDRAFVLIFFEHFTAAAEPQGVITDAGQYFFEQLGQAGLEAIMARLTAFYESGEAFTSSFEYLLVFLTQLGIKLRETDVYPMLRLAFRRSPRKVIPAICIGDYGDARGVVLLRNYIIEFEKELDRQLYYESISSIKRLGGDTRDLPDPFKDFYGQGGGPLY